MAQRKLTHETILKQQIKHYMTIKGWFIFPVTQGLGSYKGISDLIAIKNGMVIFIEVKTPRGRQSDYQKQFEIDVTKKGGMYAVIRSLDEIIELEKGMNYELSPV
jgi:Holliday junction resolvase-like predicted endonuclease